jgi:hypothetical protein
MATNKKQAILLSIMCLWFATAFIISCYHAGTKIRIERVQITDPIERQRIQAVNRKLNLPPRVASDMFKKNKLIDAKPVEWKFHWPHERRYHEDLTKFMLLVLPVFAICVPLWFIFRDSAPVSPAT